MRDVLVVVLVLSVGPAAATELRKCIAADGAVSYLDRACPDGSEQAWARDVKALVPSAGQKPDLASSKPPSKDRPPAAARVSGAPPPRGATKRDRARARCEAARRDADEQRDRLWNRLSFQQRSDLDAKVARACAR